MARSLKAFPPGVLPSQPDRPSTLIRSTRCTVSGGFALIFLIAAQCVEALSSAEAGRALANADKIKTSDPAAFVTLLQSVERSSPSLTATQRERLQYLQAWKLAYDGDYKTAVSRLEEFVPAAHDATLIFRARVTIANIQVVAAQYEKAFSQLNTVLEALPKITDKDARAQAQTVAAQLYNSVGQFNLAHTYSQALIDEKWTPRDVCRGRQLRLRALFKSEQLKDVGPEILSGIDACMKAGEPGYGNYIRTYAAQLYMDQGRYDDAIELLKDHYDEVVRTQYKLLISDFDSLLAKAYRKKGSPALARQFALSTIAKAVKDEYTEPLITAYGVLYEIHKEQNDHKGALAYHELYTLAAKDYLDDMSARHLAYQKVTHENIANKLQLDALNKQNQVLQLERQLHAKAMEASRLYIALLALIGFFIGLWAYRTKRSQLHFRNLSQLDGLTGISNRPYFIEQAQKALENAQKTGEHICIVLCDLDHFKSINDSHGHAAGDYVLKRTVSECQAHLGSGDIFGRFGGEEFGILLPTCDPAQAWQLAEQLRITIAAITIENSTTESSAVSTVVTASFGIATTGSSGYELRQLLAHADAALYEAKRSGRNRVVMHDGTLTADVLAEGRKFAAG